MGVQGVVDGPDVPTEKELSCGLHQSGQGTVGTLVEKVLWSDRRGHCTLLKGLDVGIDGIRPQHCDTGLDAEETLGPGWNDHDVHVRSLTHSMIAPKVPGIGGRLVEICLRGGELSLQLDHKNAAIQEKNHIRPAQVHGELVFEHGGVLFAALFLLQDLAHFPLKERDRIIPCPDLLDAGIGNELLQ